LEDSKEVALLKSKKKVNKYFKGLLLLSYVILIFAAFSMVKTLWLSYITRDIEEINIDNRDGSQTSITIDRTLLCFLIATKVLIAIFFGMWAFDGVSLFKHLKKSFDKKNI
jgi:Na+/proline symporter